MSSGGGELRGFVFAVVFIVIFGTLISSIPIGLQGPEETPTSVIPIDPKILTGFSEIKEIYPDNYTGAPYYYYDYNDFADRDWRTTTDDDTTLALGAKVFVWVFWFGTIDWCRFQASDGQNRGTSLEFSEIDLDSEDGTAVYSLFFSDSGDSAGSFIVYWNITEYSSVDDAWDSDEVYMIHGFGFGDTATTNIGTLIISLLFLQLPEVPVLINIFLAVPVWACVIFVAWFIIKEMIPFV